MAKMVITSNICIFFILKLVSKIVLDYLFFNESGKTNGGFQLEEWSEMGC